MAGAERGTMTALEAARAALFDCSNHLDNPPQDWSELCDALISAAQEDAASERAFHLIVQNAAAAQMAEMQAENAELRAALKAPCACCGNGCFGEGCDCAGGGCVLQERRPDESGSMAEVKDG